jgi:hypothetical protein
MKKMLSVVFFLMTLANFGTQPVMSYATVDPASPPSEVSLAELVDT